MTDQGTTNSIPEQTTRQKTVLTLEDLKQKMTEIQNLRKEALEFKPPDSEKDKEATKTPKLTGIAGWLRNRKGGVKYKKLEMSEKTLKKYQIWCNPENTYEKKEDGSNTNKITAQHITYYYMNSPPTKNSDGSLNFEDGGELDREYFQPLNEIFNVTDDFNVALKTAVREWNTEKHQKEKEIDDRSKIKFANKYMDIIRLAMKKGHR